MRSAGSQSKRWPGPKKLRFSSHDDVASANARLDHRERQPAPPQRGQPDQSATPAPTRPAITRAGTRSHSRRAVSAPADGGADADERHLPEAHLAAQAGQHDERQPDDREHDDPRGEVRAALREEERHCEQHGGADQRGAPPHDAHLGEPDELARDRAHLAHRLPGRRLGRRGRRGRASRAVRRGRRRRASGRRSRARASARSPTAR